MTREQLAAQLNGREYGNEIDHTEEKAAKEHGLVAIFGYSDDNAEFRGAIHDEVGCYDGGEFLVSRHGVVTPPDREEREVLEKFHVLEAATKGSAKIKAVWGKHGYSWTYETDIPQATFDIMDEGEKFCRGIVFNLSDIPAL